jgi:hypothetical protein
VTYKSETPESRVAAIRTLSYAVRALAAYEDTSILALLAKYDVCDRPDDIAVVMSPNDARRVAQAIYLLMETEHER